MTGTVADPVGELVCSARGCRAEAAWGLLWNNPRLHTPDRRKVWLACTEHRAQLEQFLGARGFLRSTVPVGELTSQHPGPEPDASGGARTGTP